MRCVDDSACEGDVARAVLLEVWGRIAFVLGDGAALFLVRRAWSVVADTRPDLATSTFGIDRAGLRFDVREVAGCEAARLVVREVLASVEALTGPELVTAIRADVEAIERVHRVLSLRPKRRAAP